MPKSPTATSTRALFEHLGSGIRQLAAAQPRPATYESDAAFGKQVAGFVASAVKAIIPGSQSSKQVKVHQQAAQQAVARKVARAVSKLPPVAT